MYTKQLSIISEINSIYDEKVTSNKINWFTFKINSNMLLILKILQSNNIYLIFNKYK